jgi:hypothetical protein
MTAAGQAQAAAGQAVAPALAAFNRSLARTRNAGPAGCVPSARLGKCNVCAAAPGGY